MNAGEVSRARADALQDHEERLKASLRHQQYLSAELQHRIRNMLAIIRSIVRRTADNSESIEDLINHLDGRIGTLSRIMVAVARDPLIGFDLAELIFEELRICAAHEGKQFVLDGPPVRLNPKAAESVGLAIHELATNALKFGALTISGGQIEISWRTLSRGNQTWLSLHWGESGMQGHPVEQKRRGFGIRLLQETLPYDLGAEVGLDFEPNGLHCEIAFPLAGKNDGSPKQNTHA